METSMVKFHAQYLKSALDPAHFPPAGPAEIAFVGRSNVGKSSLINSLVGEKIAKTSSTPGRTRAINFFEVRRQGQAKPEVLFVDLPGYGYAKLPVAVTDKWPEFIEPYLETRENLGLVLVLVDINIPPQNSDRKLVQWLRQIQRPRILVGTKCDRLSGNQLRKAMNNFSNEFAGEKLVSFSARTAAGHSELWAEIRAAAEAVAGEKQEDLAG